MNLQARTTGTWSASPWRIVMWAAIAAMLLAPAVAMRFTREVNWGLEDFAFAGLLLIGAGTAYEIARRKIAARSLHLAIGAALVFAVALIWAEAAVGVFS